MASMTDRDATDGTTPRPWRAWPHDHSKWDGRQNTVVGEVSCMDGRDDVHGLFAEVGIHRETANADAALIVEAVNAYDRLRAQLRETGLAYHTFNGRCTTDWSSCQSTICVATLFWSLPDRDVDDLIADGLVDARVAEDVRLNQFGEPLCAVCEHGHTEFAWSDRDPDDGTCWSTAGPLVCGCPKFITPAVQRIRLSKEVGRG